jgi:threonine/homoserine/homoserine lactone efflux protein
MLDDVALAAFIPVAFLLVITPGATTAIVVRHALAGGHRSGVATALGAAAGNATHAVIAGAGVALLLRDRPHVVDAINIAGSAFLAWLGLRSLARALTGRGITTAPAAPAAPHTAFVDGLIVTLLNPAAPTFYLVVVPGFIRGAATADRFALLAVVHVAMALGCHTLWAFAFDRLRRVLLSPTARRVVEGAAGSALVWLAVRTWVRR